jgi:hypothetical protein
MDTKFLCRIGFCQFCYDKGFPYYNQKFLTHGSHGFHVDHADFTKHDVGYTPHFYKIVSTVGSIVKVKSVCCMDECTIQLTFNNDSKKYDFFILGSSWKESQMLISDWNALLKYKRDPAYII